MDSTLQRESKDRQEKAKKKKKNIPAPHENFPHCFANNEVFSARNSPKSPEEEGSRALCAEPASPWDSTGTPMVMGRGALGSSALPGSSFRPLGFD